MTRTQKHSQETLLEMPNVEGWLGSLTTSKDVHRGCIFEKTRFGRTDGNMLAMLKASA